MKTPFLWLVGFSLAATTLSFAEDKPATGQEKQVKVTYVAPEKFTDFNTSDFAEASAKDLKYLTDLFTAHIEAQAKKCLSEGERLEIAFKDIDLAGRFEPEHGPNWQNVRVYRDITYPRMVLTFKLYGSDGQIRAEGERKLIDMNYNMNLHPPTSDPEYRHDKALLTEWMRSEFKKSKT